MKKSTRLKYSRIRRDYKSLSEKKELGVRKYSEELVIAKLSDKYFLANNTIEDIVCHRV